MGRSFLQQPATPSSAANTKSLSATEGLRPSSTYVSDEQAQHAYCQQAHGKASHGETPFSDSQHGNCCERGTAYIGNCAQRPFPGMKTEILFGAEPNPGKMSLTKTVPAAAPLLFPSSAPCTPSLAWKNNVPFTFVRYLGYEPLLPGLMSLTKTVPAAVPLLCVLLGRLPFIRGDLRAK
jgi:hypothetical protein